MDSGVSEVRLLMKNSLLAHSRQKHCLNIYRFFTEKGYDGKSLFLSIDIISELEEQIRHQRTFHDLRSSFQSLQ